MDEDPVPAARIGTYADYRSETLDEAIARGDKVVLFFHTVWCPFCKQLDQELLHDPSVIPEGVTVLKTDFDSEATLKTKYGARFQHTFVQLDANQELVTSWLGGGVAELQTNIQ